jgi:hypothetical protein
MLLMWWVLGFGLAPGVRRSGGVLRAASKYLSGFIELIPKLGTINCGEFSDTVLPSYKAKKEWCCGAG